LIRALAVLLALALSASLAARSVVLKTNETAQGGYVLGNPKAKVQLVEYMSFTCPHCAHFTVEGAAPLKHDYVLHGEIAYEVRNAVRDAFDLTAALLARCGGKQRFFGNMEMIFANQGTWTANLQKIDTAALQKADHATIVKLIAQGSGLSTMMAKRGFSNAQLNQCLTDKAATDKIIAMTKDAWEIRKIPGTPAFYINDKLAESTTTYAQLEPQIKAAVAPTIPASITPAKTEVKP
jgi:protein-disulfide isomerase